MTPARWLALTVATGLWVSNGCGRQADDRRGVSRSSQRGPVSSSATVDAMTSTASDAATLLTDPMPSAPVSGTSSVSSAPSVAEPVSSDTVIVLERAGCEARCPSYRVSIFSNGRVIYEGRKFVRTIGTVVDVAESEKIRKLVEALRATDFFGLSDQHGQTGTSGCKAVRPDAPVVTMSVSMDGRSKTVTHHHRCLGPLHEQLVILEDKIDRTAGTVRWIR